MGLNGRIRPMKKLLIILAGLIVVIFLALLIVPKLINWNGYKPRIASIVKDSTGRELRIDGDIELSIFHSLVFSARDVHLANAPGMREDGITAQRPVARRCEIVPWPSVDD
jgi:uncharacterized protein involved in outer membrane biogenesis